jgi:hypothetical protein
MGLFDNIGNAVSEYANKNRKELDPQYMINALESQAKYLAEYEANLNKVRELGLSDAIVSQLSNGSAESAAKLDAIVRNGADKIGELNKVFEKVEEGKQSFATTVAEMQTNFSEEMDSLVANLQDSLDDMNLYHESKQNAIDTIQGYIDGLDSKLPSIQAKMAQITSSLSLSVASAVPSIAPPRSAYINVPAYATGTTDAPDMFLAGEEGPELIVGARGSTVFPAEETSRLLSAAAESTLINLDAPNINMQIVELAIPMERFIATLSNWKPISESITDIPDAVLSPLEERNRIITPSDSIPLNAPDNNMGSNHSLSGSGESEIVHVIKFEGGETIRVEGNANEEQILEIMVENMRPVLAGILQQEVFEEGDGSYGF